jgi:molybdopterin converting factor small subunit
MKVKLRLFATYQQYLPEGVQGSTVEIDVGSHTSVANLVLYLGIPIGKESVILLNGVTPDLDEILQENDVLSAFPAMAGGSCLEIFGS